MRERTRFKNKIRAELAKRGIRILKNTFAKRRAAPLRELGIKAVDECLTMIRALNERIKGVSDELKRRAEENEDAKLLMTIPGVGYFSALAISAEIGDISRFSNAEKLCSYAGLVPSIHQSGSTKRYGSITKQGSKILRWKSKNVCGFTYSTIRIFRGFSTGWLRRKARKTAVAAAIKLLVAIYWMLIRKEKFRA